MMKQEKCTAVRRAATNLPRALALLAGGAFLWPFAPASAEPNPKGNVPPIEFVQARIWKNLELADFQLKGYVDTGKKQYPIVMRTKGNEIIYEFTKEPLQIRVMLSPDEGKVQRRANANDKWVDVTPTQRGERILDTDIYYEDLGLDFIRWENVTTLGTDSIKTLASFAFEATPAGPSKYAKARYWISSEYGAFLRVDGYNAKNEVIKRVEVNGVAKMGNAYIMKEMQISTMIPGRNLSSSRTWIKIGDGKEGASGL